LGQHQTHEGTGKEAGLQPLPLSLRNLVERFLSKLKHFRAVATRFEKHDANYLAGVKLAAARIWMRFYESVT
jgi:transposase